MRDLILDFLDMLKDNFPAPCKKTTSILNNNLLFSKRLLITHNLYYPAVLDSK